MIGTVVQSLATVVLTFPQFLNGLIITWPSYTLKLYESDDSPLDTKLTAYQSSMVGSLPMLGTLITTVLTTPISEKFGRKNTMLLCGVLLTLSWALVAITRNLTIILIGRFLLGFSAGLNTICMAYISEFCETRIRGTLASAPMFGFTSGITFSYVLGWVCSYNTINYLNLTLSVVTLLLTSLLKESPMYLLGKRKEKEALQSLKFYRGKSETTPDVLEELEYMRSLLEKKPGSSGLEKSKDVQENERLQETEVKDETTIWKILRTSKVAQRSIITSSVHIFLVVCMGTVAVQSYAGQFFTKAVPNLSADLCCVLLSLAVAVSSGISLSICELVPRRVLMLSATLAASTCLLLLGSQLCWSWGPQWLAALIVMLYSFCFQLGAMTPFVQMAELFIPEIKSFATSVVLSSMTIANFIILAIFHPAIQSMGIDGTYFMFAAVGFLNVTYTFIFMKETRGVPIGEIRKMFEHSLFYERHYVSIDDGIKC